MIGRIAKCKKCNNQFKIEELLYPAKTLELKPIKNDSIVQISKRNGNTKIEPNKTLPSSEIRSPKAPLTRSSRKIIYIASSLFAIALFGIAALIFIGNFHLISGSNKGHSIVRRESFAFSEFIVRAGQITSMPPKSAMILFPLGYSVLQREGIIEIDEAIKNKTDDKEKLELDQAVRNAQREINKMIRDAQRAAKNTN
jgi:hypothetical protein